LTEEPPIKPISTSRHPKRWRRNRSGKPLRKRPGTVQTNRTTSGFRGLRESVALPLVLSGLRTELMKPAAYDRFRERFRARLADSQEAAVDRLRIHDARQGKLEIDLLPAGPSVITRVCGFEIGSWTGRFGQARLAWSLQIAQAPGALPAASGSRVRSAA